MSLRLVFFGTGSFGLPSLEFLSQSGHSITAVITGHDKPSGRHLKETLAPIKAWAVQNKIEVIHFPTKDNSQFLHSLENIKADVFIVIAFGSILSENLLRIPRLMAVNLHASLLPKYRGAAPIQAALLDGEKETGVSVIRMTAALDAGDIVAQKKISIKIEDTIFSLEENLSQLGAKVLVEVLNALEKSTANFVAQKDSEATYVKKLKKTDGHLDWSRPCEALCNHVRALRRWPGSYAFHNNKRLVIKDARTAKMDETKQIPGTVLKSSESEGLFVAAGRGSLELLEIQLEGKQSLKTADFLRGYSIKKNERLT